MSRRFNIPFYVFLILTMLPVAGATLAASAGVGINPVSLQAAVQAEQQAETTLFKAKNAVKAAHDANDSEAEAAAAKSVRVAEGALEKARESKDLVQLTIRRIQIRSEMQRRMIGGTGGSVTAMQGDAYIRTKVGDLKIEHDFILQQGDEIVIGNNAYLELLFQNPSQISLGANSALTATKMQDGYFFSLASGTLKVKVWKQMRGSFRVRAPNAAVAVAAHVAEFKAEATSSDTTVIVRSGMVEVTPDGGKIVIVHAGWRIHVNPDGRNKLERVNGG